jgi:hypothetical protein
MRDPIGLLEIERLEHGEQPRTIPTVKPTIMGSARRAPTSLLRAG